MAALAISDLRPFDGEPKVRDLELGRLLSFQRPRALRQIIKRHLDELTSYGAVTENVAMTAIGNGARRQVAEYWLNEPQALLITMFARTPEAAAARRHVIAVFMAWRHGTPAPQVDAAPQPAALPAPDRWGAVKARHEAAIAIIDLADRGTTSLAMAATHLPIFKRGNRPRFWADIEVREAVIRTHRQMPIDAAVALIVERFGKSRAPTRSAVGRVWKRLDAARGGQ